jgi:transketolase
VRTAFISALEQLAETDTRIWLVTGDLGFSVLERFRDRFPERYVNVGVAEQNMIGVAAGLADSGKCVFTYSIANFATLRCLEQIRNDVCHRAANVKVVSVGGGLSYGPQGYTHHGIEDLAIMRALPGITVVAPGDPVETELAVRALVATTGPAYLRLGKATEPLVHVTSPRFEIGRVIPLRQGVDACVLTTGAMLGPAMAAADRLAAAGIEVAVWSIHTVKPLDICAVLDAARRFPVLITAEEHTVVGGLGSAVAEVISELNGSRAALWRYALPDRVSHLIGSQDFLRTSLAGELDLFIRSAITAAGSPPFFSR